MAGGDGKEQRGITRRTFIKGTAAGAGALAVVGLPTGAAAAGRTYRKNGTRLLMWSLWATVELEP